MNITLKPIAILSTRLDAHLSTRQAAGLLYLTEDQYCRYESGAEPMPYGLYELFGIKIRLLVNPSLRDALDELTIRQQPIFFKPV